MFSGSGYAAASAISPVANLTIYQLGPCYSALSPSPDNVASRCLLEIFFASMAEPGWFQRRSADEAMLKQRL
jgi:hypothetical protein